MQLLSKFNKGFRFLLCVIDIFSKYAWVIPLKDKKGASIVNAFQKILDTSYIYKNELDKACFQHDMAYGDFKDLPKRAAAGKVLRDKAFKIASDQKYDGYQRGLA